MAQKDYDEGAQLAADEIHRGEWTRERAKAYLSEVTPSDNDFARGYDNKIREFSESGLI